MVDASARRATHYSFDCTVSLFCIVLKKHDATCAVSWSAESGHAPIRKQNIPWPSEYSNLDTNRNGMKKIKIEK